MTTVYFVRHAQPNYSNHDDAARELTEKGLSDRKLVTDFLADKGIDRVLSSPYKRAVDTVKDFADQVHLPIETIDDFRERKVDSVWIEDFNAFCKHQWADFDYKYQDGETLREVQTRNIAALRMVLEKYPNETIAVGSHGTAISTILHHYDNSFGYEAFEAIKSLMPWIVKLTFERTRLLGIEAFDILSLAEQ